MAVRWRGLTSRVRVETGTSGKRTAVIAVGLVVAMTGTMLLLGVGISSARPDLANIGAWLASAVSGEVVHANGLSGQVDGRVRLAAAEKGALKITEDGNSILVLDDGTGKVSRIDPTQLNVAQKTSLGAEGVRLVSGSGKTYAIDPRAGTVRQLDPLRLNTIGSPITLKPPLGQGGIDKNGTLWVPVPRSGTVAQIQGAQQGEAVTVGEPGDPLTLTMAQGVPVVTDSAAASAAVLGPTGIQLKVSLPSTVTQAGPAGVLAPIRTEGPIVPILAPQQGTLVLLDVTSGGLNTVSVRGGRLGSPQALGHRVYITDESSGRLIVYDAAAGRFEPEVVVTGKAGPLDVFVRDGLLWVNDQFSATAIVVQADGAMHRVGKYETSPGTTTATPTPIPVPSLPATTGPARP
ncbi:MAG TPA: hypothetical protein VIR33_05630, partial [Thermopolyspora sp.]